MKSHEIILCQSIIEECACIIKYAPPYGKEAIHYGIVEAFMRDKLRYRLLLFDPRKGVFFTDDTKRPQQLTIDIENVKRVHTCANVTYPQKKSSIDQAKAVLNKHHLNYSLLSMLDYAKTYRAIATIDTFEITHYHQTLSEPLPGGFSVHQNVLTLIQEGKKIPILSYRYVYDINTQTYLKKELYRHEDSLNHRHIPLRITNYEHIDAFKRIGKVKGAFDETPWFFTLSLKIKPAKIARFDSFNQAKANRPMRAYFERLTLKNLGRKDYYLPYFKEKLRLLENRIAESSLKHPVTLVDVTDRGHLEQLLTHIKKTSLANQQKCLILDPYLLTQEVPVLPGELNMLNQENIIKVFAKLGTDKPSDIVDITSNEALLDQLNNALEKADDYAIEMAQLQVFLKHFQAVNDFHQTIVMIDKIEQRERQCPTIPLEPIYKHLIEQKDFDDVLTSLHHERNRRSNQAGYQKIKKVLSDPENFSILGLIKLLKNTAQFHRIKHCLPLMTLRNSEQIPYAMNAFDQVVLIHPHPGNVLDFIYADKLTIITLNAYESDVFNTPTLPVNMRMSFAETLAQYDCEGVNRFHFGRPFKQGETVYHTLDNSQDQDTHLSMSEIKHIKTFIEDSPFPHYDIRTPFNVQRKALKAFLNHPARTLHEPLTDQPTIVSLAITQSMAKETYDWLKNQPDIIDNLYHQRPINMQIFFDPEALLEHVTGDDALFGLFKDHFFPKQKQFYTIHDLTWLLYRALFPEMRGFLEKEAHFPKEWNYKKQKHPRYILRNQKNSVVLVVLSYWEWRDASDIKFLQKIQDSYSVDIVMINTKEQRRVMDIFKILPEIVTHKTETEENSDGSV